MKAGISFTVSATLGRHTAQTTLGWSLVSQSDEPDEPEGAKEEVDLTSERVPVGFRTTYELEESEEIDDRRRIDPTTATVE